MNKNNHPFALLLKGPTKHLLILWGMLACICIVVALDVNGILHISPNGALQSMFGLIFVGVLWLTVSIELIRRWVAR